jgi:hypothetical protein
MLGCSNLKQPTQCKLVSIKIHCGYGVWCKSALLSLAEMLSTYLLTLAGTSFTGLDEGIYAWIATNYALGRLGGDPNKTVGIIELGGASAQVQQ